MSLTRRRFLLSSGLTAAYVSLGGWIGDGTDAEAAGPQPLELASGVEVAAVQDPATLHLLNRITYGPRPGDVQRVASMGLEAYLAQQLRPETIDDSALQRRLASFETLTMRNGQLLATYKDGSDPPPYRVVKQLQLAALLRAAYSKRQLLEVMVDFWSNHLHVYNDKDQTRWFKTSDDRDVIRRHALGKFRNMLQASAKSPAMLEYLDNKENLAPPPDRSWLGGINENYARELLELHTVGSDAGYSERDVRAVARAFTGWTLDRPWSDRPEERSNPGEFRFIPYLHDNGEKRIPFLNLTLPAGGGVRDGQTVLARLATHPRTARRIAHKLAVHFVSDNPPAALVDRIAKTYLSSDTDIRATLGVLLRSPEFRAARGQRVKLPMRALVSYVRALGAQVTNPDVLLWQSYDLGQPPFGWHGPDGYPQVGAAWLNTSGILARWNTAFALAAGWNGVQVNLRRFIPAGPITAARMVDSVAPTLLNGTPTAATRAALIEYVGGDGQPLPDWMVETKLLHLVAIVLGSPAFQVH